MMSANSILTEDFEFGSLNFKDRFYTIIRTQLIPYDIINDYYTFEESFHEISNRSQYEAYHYAMKLNEDGMAVNRSGERDLLEKFTFKIIHRNTDDWIVEMKFLWHQGNHTRSAQGAYEVKDWDVDIYKYKAADSLS